MPKSYQSQSEGELVDATNSSIATLNNDANSQIFSAIRTFFVVSALSYHSIIEGMLRSL